MIWVQRATIVAMLFAISACDPVSTGTAPNGASQAKYERHKANREAYLYQGL